MIVKLDEKELESSLSCIPEWRVSTDTCTSEKPALCRKLIFKDFTKAWSFMNQVAVECEKQHHHPEWTNIYNQVDIRLSTHDVNGISTKDIQLAQTIDHIYKDWEK